MKLRLDYGTSGLPVEFASERVQVIEPHYVPPAVDVTATLRRALQTPIGRPPLRALVTPGRKIGISVCDITRAQPRQAMLEALLAEMPGVDPRDITIFIATGTHRQNTPVEIERMIGAEFARACRTRSSLLR